MALLGLSACCTLLLIAFTIHNTNNTVIIVNIASILVPCNCWCMAWIPLWKHSDFSKYIPSSVLFRDPYLNVCCFYKVPKFTVRGCKYMPKQWCLYVIHRVYTQWHHIQCCKQSNVLQNIRKMERTQLILTCIAERQSMRIYWIYSISWLILKWRHAISNKKYPTSLAKVPKGLWHQLKDSNDSLRRAR